MIELANFVGDSGNAQMQEKYLQKFAALGFSWKDVARIANVSDVALQRARYDKEALTIKSIQRMSTFFSAYDHILYMHSIPNVTAWFETRIIDDVPVTPIELYLSNKTYLMFRYADGFSTPEEIMNEFDIGWKNKYNSDWESFIAEDGITSLRPKLTTAQE